MNILTFFYCISIFIHHKIYRYVRKKLRFLAYLKRPKNYKGGEMPVYLRITVDGVEKEMSAKRSWEPSRWNVKSNRALGTKEDARALNTYLDVLQNKAYEARKQLIEKGKVVTAMAIRDLLSGTEQRQWMLMSLFRKHNADLKAMVGKGVSNGTCTNFDTTYKHTLRFLKKEYSCTDTNILSLDLAFIKRLYNWYRIDKGLDHRPHLITLTEDRSAKW
jgi:hypothetical protein